MDETPIVSNMVYVYVVSCSTLILLKYTLYSIFQ